MNKDLIEAGIETFKVSNLPKNTRESCINSMIMFSKDFNMQHIDEITKLINNCTGISVPMQTSLNNIVAKCITDVNTNVSFIGVANRNY